jgi:hypothetical protein
MTTKKFACLGTLALLAGAAPALAQQVIQAPGITIIFGAPPANLPAAQDQFAAMRAIDAQMDAQMNAQMAQMNQIIQAEQQLTATQAAPSLTQAAFGNANAAGVFVTTISENGQSCTERVVYPGNGAPAKISVSQTGNACASLHLGGQPAPVALHTSPAQPAPAQTIQVRNETTAQSKPIMLADRDN